MILVGIILFIGLFIFMFKVEDFKLPNDSICHTKFIEKCKKEGVTIDVLPNELEIKPINVNHFAIYVAKLHGKEYGRYCINFSESSLEVELLKKTVMYSKIYRKGVVVFDYDQYGTQDMVTFRDKEFIETYLYCQGHHLIEKHKKELEQEIKKRKELTEKEFMEKTKEDYWKEEKW